MSSGARLVAEWGRAGSQLLLQTADLPPSPSFQPSFLAGMTPLTPLKGRPPELHLQPSLRLGPLPRPRPRQLFCLYVHIHPSMHWVRPGALARTGNRKASPAERTGLSCHRQPLGQGACRHRRSIPTPGPAPCWGTLGCPLDISELQPLTAHKDPQGAPLPSLLTCVRQRRLCHPADVPASLHDPDNDRIHNCI